MDGDRLRVWIHHPAGPGLHRVSLDILGGSLSQYGRPYADGPQVYAVGCRVLQCIPIGSTSYGSEHRLAIGQAMGTVDLADVMTCFDGACAANPELDAETDGLRAAPTAVI